MFGRAASERALTSALAALREPRTTMGGVNLVGGSARPLARDGAEEPRRTLEGFDAPSSDSDGFTMPATQHDAVVWLSGSAYDVIFDMSLGAIQELGRPSPPSPTRPRAGRTSTTGTSPASSTGARTQRWSTPPTSRSSLTERPAQEARSSSCRSGATTPPRGPRFRSTGGSDVIGRTKARQHRARGQAR